MSVIYLKSCPKCQGDLYEAKDSYGAFHQCLQCGFSKDLEAPSLMLTKQVQAEVTKAKRTQRLKKMSRTAVA